MASLESKLNVRVSCARCCRLVSRGTVDVIALQVTVMNSRRLALGQ